MRVESSLSWRSEKCGWAQALSRPWFLLNSEDAARVATARIAPPDRAGGGGGEIKH